MDRRFTIQNGIWKCVDVPSTEDKPDLKKVPNSRTAELEQLERKVRMQHARGSFNDSKGTLSILEDKILNSSLLQKILKYVTIEDVLKYEEKVKRIESRGDLISQQFESTLPDTSESIHQNNDNEIRLLEFFEKSEKLEAVCNDLKHNLQDFMQTRIMRDHMLESLKVSKVWTEDLLAKNNAKIKALQERNEELKKIVEITQKKNQRILKKYKYGNLSNSALSKYEDFDRQIEMNRISKLEDELFMLKSEKKKYMKRKRCYNCYEKLDTTIKQNGKRENSTTKDNQHESSVATLTNTILVMQKKIDFWRLRCKLNNKASQAAMLTEKQNVNLHMLREKLCEFAKLCKILAEKHEPPIMQMRNENTEASCTESRLQIDPKNLIEDLKCDTYNSIMEIRRKVESLMDEIYYTQLNHEFNKEFEKFYEKNYKLNKDLVTTSNKTGLLDEYEAESESEFELINKFGLTKLEEDSTDDLYEKLKSLCEDGVAPKNLKLKDRNVDFMTAKIPKVSHIKADSIVNQTVKSPVNINKSIIAEEQVQTEDKTTEKTEIEIQITPSEQNVAECYSMFSSLNDSEFRESNITERNVDGMKNSMDIFNKEFTEGGQIQSPRLPLGKLIPHATNKYDFYEKPMEELLRVLPPVDNQSYKNFLKKLGKNYEHQQPDENQFKFAETDVSVTRNVKTTSDSWRTAEYIFKEVQDNSHAKEKSDLQDIKDTNGKTYENANCRECITNDNKTKNIKIECTKPSMTCNKPEDFMEFDLTGIVESNFKAVIEKANSLITESSVIIEDESKVADKIDKKVSKKSSQDIMLDSDSSEWIFI